WRIFADYAAGLEGGAEGLEQASRLLAFLLRMLRAAVALRARHGGGGAEASGGYRWTAKALEAEGWDASLAPYLGTFEGLDLRAFSIFLSEAHRAVREYSKPSIALTGLFLEYEAAREAHEEAVR